jgi:hypothetical protein
MSVKIGHASLDENKKTKGGQAGDQTGGEVCTRTWYSKPWQFVLRPKNSTLAEKSAQACEKGCANNKIGYDQNQRNTLYTQASKVGFDLSKITTACECDCSAFMHVCALAGGANIPYGSNGAATSTMKAKFTANGDYEVLTDSKYLTSDKYLKRGDILVKAGSHTVMVLENGSAVTSTTTTSSTNPYTEPTKTVTSKAQAKVKGIKTYSSSGDDVRWVQWHLDRLCYDLGSYGIDGACGSTTVKAIIAFQEACGITADGLAGSTTRTYLKK